MDSEETLKRAAASVDGLFKDVLRQAEIIRRRDFDSCSREDLIEALSVAVAALDPVQQWSYSYCSDCVKTKGIADRVAREVTRVLGRSRSKR